MRSAPQSGFATLISFSVSDGSSRMWMRADDRGRLEDGMRATHDSAKGLHVGKSCCAAKMRPEFISYSEWESEPAIEAYRNSQAHQEIVRHARALKGAKAEVKLYDVVQ